MDYRELAATGPSGPRRQPPMPPERIPAIVIKKCESDNDKHNRTVFVILVFLDGRPEEVEMRLEG
jgi:hypothetical protein